MITLIKGKYVIGFKEGKHVIISDGEIAYEDENIIYVGKNYTGHYDEVIDERNSLISPGMIDLDALGGVDQALIEYECPDPSYNYLAWSEEYFNYEREEEFTKEEEDFKSLYAYVNLIMNGVTTAMPITSVCCKKAGETYEEIVSAAHNAGKLGLRTYLGPSYLTYKPVLSKDNELIYKELPEHEVAEGIANAERFIKEFDGAYNGLIKGVVVPERIQLQSEEMLIKSKELSRKYDCLIRLHAAQQGSEYDLIKEKHGLSPIAYLNSINFLDERTLIPHCIYTSGSSMIEDKSDNDLDIMARTNMGVIHCPIVFCRQGDKLESFGRFYRKGITMTMGTDTFPPDMFENIKIGSYIAKCVDNNRRENYLDYFFNAATIGGAKALGREDLGKLSVGAKADIIIIDMSRFEIGVLDIDPLKTFILSGNGSYVKTSIINGKTVMRDRQIKGIDLEKLQDKAQKYFDKLKYTYKNSSNFVHLKDSEYFRNTFEILM